MDALDSHRMTFLFAGLAALLALRAWLSALRWRSRTRGLPLPPGPRPLPIVGNYFDIPGRDGLPWERYRDMSKRYGDLLYLQSMGQGLLILGGPKVTFELLEKRSTNYSDRPKSGAFKMLAADWLFVFNPYGPQWRQSRREFWQHFNPIAVKKYDSVQREETHKLLKRLLDDPTELRDTLRFTVGAAILRSVYDINVKGNDDPVIVAQEQAMEGIAECIFAGSVLELIPILRFWPPIQKRLAHHRAANERMKDLPYSQAKMRQDESEYESMVDCLRKRILNGSDYAPEHREDIVKGLAAISYAGGSESTFSAMETFFLAMSLCPEVQKKAQAQIDDVVGHDRLPEANDADRLPYVKAVVKECLRWQNIGPLGMPHASVVDDVYEGYFIPAGTVVVANTWAMLHDPSVYPNPMEFQPERYLKDGRLDPEAPDPMKFALGYGRRICPGRHYAERTLFINIVSILSIFDITPPLDSAGRPIRIEPKQTSSPVSHPVDCRCTITPRSKAVVDLVSNAVQNMRL